jgi:hypothetical protein
MREEELKNAKLAGVEAKAAELAELKGKLGASLKANLVQMQEQIQTLEQLPVADEKSGRAGTDNVDEPPEYHGGWLNNRGWLSYRGWRDMYERIEPLQAGCPDRLPSAIEVALAECEPQVQEQSEVSEVSIGSTLATPREEDALLQADRADGGESGESPVVIYSQDNLMWVTEFGTPCTPRQSFEVLESPRTPRNPAGQPSPGQVPPVQWPVPPRKQLQSPRARLQSPRTPFISIQEEASESFKTRITTDSQSNPNLSFEFKLESPLPPAGISTFRRPQRSTFGQSNAACRFLGDNGMHINIDIQAGTSYCRLRAGVAYVLE